MNNLKAFGIGLIEVGKSWKSILKWTFLLLAWVIGCLTIGIVLGSALIYAVLHMPHFMSTFLDRYGVIVDSSLLGLVLLWVLCLRIIDMGKQKLQK